MSSLFYGNPDMIVILKGNYLPLKQKSVKSFHGGGRMKVLYKIGWMQLHIYVYATTWLLVIMLSYR